MVAERRVRRRDLAGTRQYRIIPSRFPVIRLFEDLVVPEDLPIAYAIEALTNDRIQAEVGDINLVPREQWVSGPGASVVMAAFTHVGAQSRFSDGSYGVYYAALSVDTAVTETVFHTERRLKETSEPPIEVEMRCYAGTATTRFDDIRSRQFADLADPDLATWPRCQRFAAERRAGGSEGLYYRSARDPNGLCLAAFRPKAVSKPRTYRHFRYRWNGERIDQVMTVMKVEAR